MTYIKTVGLYFCTFYKNEEPDEKTPRKIEYSESDFGTIEEAEKWCKNY